ncbi:hypothetical protein PTKIN_Ptkin13bG0248200 [Pterospermum kingtungense]
MAVGNAAVNNPVSVQASSDFTLQRDKAPASFEANPFSELPDYVVFDRVHQCNRINSPFEENLINELPDHILVSILSLLNLKEAARTSILSRRWVYLWTYTRRLVFEDPQVVKSPEVASSGFINWVNSILKFYQGTTLDEFTVCFDLDEQSCKLDIDSWIIFALEKRAQCLHLNFRLLDGYFHMGSYTLTTQFLSNCTINSLKVLRLISVEVSGEVVEYILSACPLLELLCVKTSLSLWGRRPIANINNVPNLVEFSWLLSQLETLVPDIKFERFRRFPKFPKLNNLKHLEMLLDGYHARSLLSCAKLVESFSLLQRFTLKVSNLYSNLYRFQYRSVKEQEPKPVLQHLKVIEFIGFAGCVVEVELLLCLLGRAVSLKRLMIDPCSYTCGMRFDRGPELLLAARNRAKQLKTRLPPGAELVIL